MARGKSLTLSMDVDAAERAHKCRFNKRHDIKRGDLRLKVKNNRSYAHYCVSCAKSFIQQGHEHLRSLAQRLEGTDGKLEVAVAKESIE